MTYDPHDPAQVKARKREGKAKADPKSLVFQWVASDQRGRQALAMILNDSQYMTVTHVPGDPLQSAFNEGRRSIGLALHLVLTHAGVDVSTITKSQEVNERDDDN